MNNDINWLFKKIEFNSNLPMLCNQQFIKFYDPEITAAITIAANESVHILRGRLVLVEE
jgi:hypothetical protein